MNERVSKPKRIPPRVLKMGVQYSPRSMHRVAANRGDQVVHKKKKRKTSDCMPPSRSRGGNRMFTQAKCGAPGTTRTTRRRREVSPNERALEPQQGTRARRRWKRRSPEKARRRRRLIPSHRACRTASLCSARRSPVVKQTPRVEQAAAPTARARRSSISNRHAGLSAIWTARGSPAWLGEHSGQGLEWCRRRGIRPH